jgi:hypothetical protein
LVGIFLDAEDGCNTFLKNIGRSSVDCMIIQGIHIKKEVSLPHPVYARRYNSSCHRIENGIYVPVKEYHWIQGSHNDDYRECGLYYDIV